MQRTLHNTLSGTGMQTCLCVKENGQPRQIDCAELMSIGRDESNHIELHYARVSRRQATRYPTWGRQ